MVLKGCQGASCLVMPISVMAASITICNHISMENLNPGGGQISDGSDI